MKLQRVAQKTFWSGIKVQSATTKGHQMKPSSNKVVFTTSLLTSLRYVSHQFRK